MPLVHEQPLKCLSVCERAGRSHTLLVRRASFQLNSHHSKCCAVVFFVFCLWCSSQMEYIGHLLKSSPVPLHQEHMSAAVLICSCAAYTKPWGLTKLWIEYYCMVTDTHTHCAAMHMYTCMLKPYPCCISTLSAIHSHTRASLHTDTATYHFPPISSPCTNTCTVHVSASVHVHVHVCQTKQCKWMHII